MADELHVGQILSNKELRRVFKVGAHGGIRISRAQNLIVVVADFQSPIYSDRWVGNTLEFVAAGQRGDQTLSASRNRSLLAAESEGRSILLFDKYSPNENIYRGLAYVVGEPEEARGADFDGDDRRIFVFKLRPLHKSIARNDFESVLTFEIVFHDKEADWPLYFMKRIKEGLRLPKLSEKRIEIIFNALWREYAASRVDSYLRVFESLTGQIPVVVPEYDLEHGSIVAKIKTGVQIAAYTAMLGNYYPGLKENAPQIAKDILAVAQKAADKASEGLGDIKLRIPNPYNPSDPIKPTLGPPPWRPALPPGYPSNTKDGR